MKTVSLCIFLACTYLATVPLSAQNWPNWRGPAADGRAADSATPPVQWSETENVKWKVRIPGRGNSTPVIWGDRLFLLSAEPVDKEAATDRSFLPEGAIPVQRGGGMSRSQASPHRFLVLCLDANTGKTLWQKTAREGMPAEGTHGHNTFASGSPVTDGRRVVAHFGSQGTYCYDLDGQLLWEKDLGEMTMRGTFGEGLTPALHGDRVIVPWDHEGQSFLACLHADTGAVLWKVDREEGTCWSAPIVVGREGGSTVVVNGHYTAGYDLADGTLKWWTGGHTQRPVTSPVYGDGVVYAASGFRGSLLLAIPLEPGEKDVTEKRLFTRESATPDVPSLLLSEGRLYMTQGNTGIITCLDAKTGEPYYERERLEGVREIYASPMAAGGHVYWVGRNGTTSVIKDAPRLETVSVNELDQEIDGSPVAVGKRLYLRGKTHLYCIE